MAFFANLCSCFRGESTEYTSTAIERYAPPIECTTQTATALPTPTATPTISPSSQVTVLFTHAIFPAVEPLGKASPPTFWELSRNIHEVVIHYIDVDEIRKMFVEKLKVVSLVFSKEEQNFIGLMLCRARLIERFPKKHQELSSLPPLPKTPALHFASPEQASLHLAHCREQFTQELRQNNRVAPRPPPPPKRAEAPQPPKEDDASLADDFSSLQIDSSALHFSPEQNLKLQEFLKH